MIPSSVKYYILSYLFLVTGIISSLDLVGQQNVVYRDESGHQLEVFRQKMKNRQALEAYMDKITSEETERGFLTFGVDSIFTEGDNTTVIVHRGDRFSFADAKEQSLLSRQIRGELDRLEDVGYPFAYIEVSTVLDSLQLDHSFRLFKGPMISMDSLVFLEEPSLPTRVLSTHLGIHVGSPYSESKIASIDRKLKALPFVKVVRPASVIFADGRARAILAIEKRNANRMDGIIGFQPDAEGNSQFTGDLKLELYNALSHLDLVKLNWQRVADNSQKLDFSIRYPYLFRTSLGVQASIGQFRQDTTFNEIQLKTGLFSVLSKGSSVEFFLLSKAVNDLRSTDNSNQQNTSTLQYGISYEYDGLDDPVNPIRGPKSNVSFSYGDKSVSGQNEGQAQSRKVGQWVAALDLRNFFPIRGRSTMLIRLNGRHTDSEVILPNELERVGGLFTLRGHDEQSIRASTYLIGTTEFRLLTGEMSYLNTFLDYGYIESNTINGYVSDRPYGFGLGAAIDTGSGILGLSYALGSRFEQAIDLNTGKLHLGYTAIF